MNTNSAQSTPSSIRKEVVENGGLTSKRRSKSVQWADREMKDVMDFVSTSSTSQEISVCDSTELITSESVERRNEQQKSFNEGAFPLIEQLVQTTMEISSVASRSPAQSVTSYASVEVDDEKENALIDLITHLEDTAALLREYLAPPKQESVTDLISFEQTSFLLRYQVVLVIFTQIINILLLTLFDHLMEGEKDTGYYVLDEECMSQSYTISSSADPAPSQQNVSTNDSPEIFPDELPDSASQEEVLDNNISKESQSLLVSGAEEIVKTLQEAALLCKTNDKSSSLKMQRSIRKINRLIYEPRTSMEAERVLKKKFLSFEDKCTLVKYMCTIRKEQPEKFLERLCGSSR